MVDVTGFLKKAGILKESGPKAASEKPAAKAGASATAKPAGAGTAGAVPKSGVPGEKKGFDINMYMKAVGLFFSDFYGKKLPYFFKNMGPVLKGFPGWWGKLPQDEQLSYGAVALGHVMVVVAIVMFIVV